jgi:hypothetical protein
LAFLVADQNAPFADPRFLAIAAFALLWLYLIEAHWFSEQLGGTLARGLKHASILMGQWLILIVAAFIIIG